MPHRVVTEQQFACTALVCLNPHDLLASRRCQDHRTHSSLTPPLFFCLLLLLRLTKRLGALRHLHNHSLILCHPWRNALTLPLVNNRWKTDFNRLDLKHGPFEEQETAEIQVGQLSELLAGKCPPCMHMCLCLVQLHVFGAALPAASCSVTCDMRSLILSTPAHASADTHTRHTPVCAHTSHSHTNNHSGLH